MSRLFTVVCMMGLVSLANTAKADSEYYQIKNYKLEDITQSYMSAHQDLNGSQAGLEEMCQPTGKGIIVRRGSDASANGFGTMAGPLDQIEAWVDQIINIGKKIFNIVEKGRPVVNQKYDTANALPRGVNCWLDLNGWNMPNTKVFRAVYKNGMDAEVVSFTFRLNMIAGGGANGLGKYITNATVLPASLHVSYGFTFNSDATIPAVFNRGTAEAPLAGMQVNVHYTVNSLFSHNEKTHSFYLGGDNTMTELQ